MTPTGVIKPFMAGIIEVAAVYNADPMGLMPPLKDVPPEVSGIRNLLVPPDIVAVRRTSPPRVRKRTPWRPRPDGEGTAERTGGREWFSDRLFVEPQDGHPRSAYSTSIVVHVCLVAAFLTLVIHTPVEPLVVRESSAIQMMFAVVSPPPPTPAPAGPTAVRERPRSLEPVGAPSPAPPPPPAGDPAAPAAPVEAPASIAPDTGAETRVAGVDGGAVSGGISGGVIGGTGHTASAPGTPGPAVVRVGATLKPPKKIKDVKPEYPAVAATSRTHGSVVIEATIGPDGKVQDAKVLVSIPLLDQAALDAVRQWEYEPPRLNGVPVAVIMTIVVNFGLQ